MSDTIGKKKFINEIATSMYMGPKTMFTMLRDFIKANPKRTPDKPISINFIDTLSLQDVNQTKVIWFGSRLVGNGRQKSIVRSHAFEFPFTIFIVRR